MASLVKARTNCHAREPAATTEQGGAGPIGEHDARYVSGFGRTASGAAGALRTTAGQRWAPRNILAFAKLALDPRASAPHHRFPFGDGRSATTPNRDDSTQSPHATPGVTPAVTRGKIPDVTPEKPAQGGDARAVREARSAEALRQNLKRRKQQARDRESERGERGERHDDAGKGSDTGA